MSASASAAQSSSLIRCAIAKLGGRYSTEAGIDVDRGSREIDRWFLAATLFGTRISATIAMRTYRTLSAAGVDTIDDAGRRDWDDLVKLLGEGGYARYDYRTATRLHDLSAAVAEQHPNGIEAFGASQDDSQVLTQALDALPGWGPVTVAAFLRELRGLWPAANPPVEHRATAAAHHLRLVGDTGSLDAAKLAELATGADVDVRDLEAALIRLALAHRSGSDRCRFQQASGCRYLTEH